MTTIVAIENHRIPKQNSITDLINSNEDLATRAVANWQSIPYSNKKQIVSTHENARHYKRSSSR
jgi:hypothetical protein